MRKRFSLAFALLPLAIVVPSYLFGEYLTQSPGAGYHRYGDMHWMALSALLNAPLLGFAAFLMWPLVGYNRDNLFYKSFIGNAFFGFILPAVTICFMAYAAALLGFVLRFFGKELMDSPMFFYVALVIVAIYSSTLFLALGGGILGLIFGELERQRKDAG